MASRCIDQGDVPIDSPSDTDRSVPQALLHDLGVDSHRDQDGSSAVAQIMEAKCRELCLMQQLFDLMSQDGLVEISSKLVGEDQVVDLPGRRIGRGQANNLEGVA
jgi:hypothetical protein